jgi:flagellar biosynthesis chaperone FliJ
MFSGEMFNKWLDRKIGEIVKQMSSGKGISPESLLLMTVKTQTTHFENINKELRDIVLKSQENIDNRLTQVEEQIEQNRKSIAKIEDRIELLHRHLDQNNSRFDTVDTKFEKTVDRIDKLMVWSGAIAVVSTVFLLGTMFVLIK